jgi:hypothetical protein
MEQGGWGGVTSITLATATRTANLAENVFPIRNPGSETGSKAAHSEDLNLLASSSLSRSFSEV